MRQAIRSVSFVPLVLALSGPLFAQEPTKRGQHLIEVTRAGPDEMVGCSAAYQNGAAPARNGALFVLVSRATFGRQTGGNPGVLLGADLELWRSDDGGLTWRRAASTPTGEDGNGSLIPDGDLLACLWSSRQGTPFSHVFFQRYDPANDRWLGEPVRLAEGVSVGGQYHAGDLVRTTEGALVAVFGNDAAALGPAWTCSWSTGMRWLKAGAAATDWSPVVQVNVNNYGCTASASARGSLVDITYRTNPGEAIHGLRTVDGATGQFAQPTDENAGPEPGPGQYIANLGILCGDGVGGRSLLHLLGDHAPGNGRLAVSWSRPGEPLRTTTIASDPVLCAGNENPQHFTLARGPGNQVFALFSKQSEGFADLWQCVLEDGRPVGEAKVVAHGDKGAFVTLTGMRCSEVWSGLRAVTLGRTEQHPGGIVSVFGAWPARSVWNKPTAAAR